MNSDDFNIIAKMVQKAVASQSYGIAQELRVIRDMMYYASINCYGYIQKPIVSKGDILTEKDFNDIDRIIIVNEANYNKTLLSKLKTARECLRIYLNQKWTDDLLKNIEIYDF